MTRNSREHFSGCLLQSALGFWHNQSIAPSPESIELLGGDWVGEDALATRTPKYNPL